MNDQERLAGYVDIWWTAIDNFTKVLETIPPEQWATQTDLAGWDVQAIAAHTAHLESILAGAPEETVDVGEPDHVTGLMGLYTEQGVVARRGRSTDELINEIRSAATSRHTALLADPPTDGAARPARTFGGIGWDWETAAAQPAAGRLDARAGRTTGDRPAWQPGLGTGPAHR